MDDPDLDPGRHRRALRALDRVGFLSWSAGRVWRELLALGLAPDRPMRMLDLACGGGGVVIGLAVRGRRAGLPLEVHGADRSDTALAYARERAARTGVDATFTRLDVVADALPDGFDLVTSSLFLHHLDTDAAAGFLRKMASVAPAILLQDLRRTRRGWALALLTLNTVARSDVARVDGPRSVAGAFTLEEARDLARRAGLDGARVSPCWPQRFALRWRRP